MIQFVLETLKKNFSIIEFYVDAFSKGSFTLRVSFLIATAILFLSQIMGCIGLSESVKTVRL